MPKSQAPPKPKSPKFKRSTTTSQSQDTRRRRSSALDTKTAQASESSVRRVVNLHWLTLSPPTRGQALNSLQHQYDPGPGPLDWHSDHFLVVRSVLQPGQEDYFKEIAGVLPNYSNEESSPPSATWKKCAGTAMSIMRLCIGSDMFDGC